LQPFTPAIFHWIGYQAHPVENGLLFLWADFFVDATRPVTDLTIESPFTFFSLRAGGIQHFQGLGGEIQPQNRDWLGDEEVEQSAGWNCRSTEPRSLEAD
jgi:hypothetical protein